MRPWFDAHVHVLGGGSDALDELRRIETGYGYTDANLLSVEGMDDAAQNALAIAWKLDGEREAAETDGASHRYALGGLHHRYAYDYRKELETVWALGFDGLKMIENKPTERRRWGIAQNDPALDPLYAYAEENDIPLLIHVNDPREFWDEKRCPAWARDAGYFYDGSFVSFEQILSESLDMLKKHPRLRVCFAHFLFLSDDEPALRDILQAYPNVCLDVTAGTEMYPNFARDPAVWRRFFGDFADRILYGTDNCASMNAEDKRIADVLNNLERRFFLSRDPIPLWEDTVEGLGLAPDGVQALLYGNAKRFFGAKPRPVNRVIACRYLRERLSDKSLQLTEREHEITTKTLAKCLQ